MIGGSSCLGAEVRSICNAFDDSWICLDLYLSDVLGTPIDFCRQQAARFRRGSAGIRNSGSLDSKRFYTETWVRSGGGTEAPAVPTVLLNEDSAGLWIAEEAHEIVGFAAW